MFRDQGSVAMRDMGRLATSPSRGMYQFHKMFSGFNRVFPGPLATNGSTAWLGGVGARPNWAGSSARAP